MICFKFYEGFDLLDLLELHGWTPQKFAQKVLSKIFTRQELINTVFLDEDPHVKSNRTRCDPEKLKIIKSKSNDCF